MYAPALLSRRALALGGVAFLVLWGAARASSATTKTTAGCSCQSEFTLGDYEAKYTGQCGHDGTGADKPLRCKQKDDGRA